MALAASLAGSIALWFLGERLIRLWVGSGWEDGTPVLLIFLVFYVIANLTSPARELLKGQGRVRLLAFLAVADTLANLALSAVLVQFLGITGVALGSLIPLVVANLLLLLPYA